MSKGGRRPGAGRRKGVPNKVTADIKALAQQYVPEAVRELGRLSVEAQSETARVAAIGMILDRAYGKATQMIAGDPDGAPIGIQVIRRVIVDPKADEGEE